MKKFIIDIINIILDAILGVLDNTGILEDIARFFGNTIDAEDIIVNDETIINDEDAENVRAIKNGWNPDDYGPDDVERFLLSEGERIFINEQNLVELQKKFDEEEVQNEKSYLDYTMKDVIDALSAFEKNADNVDESCIFGFIKYKVMNPDTEERVGDIYDSDDIINAVAKIREMYLNIPFAIYYDYLYEVIGDYESILEEREKTEVIPF